MPERPPTNPAERDAPAGPDRDAPKRTKRASKGRVRTWAWMAGSLSFLAPFAAFGLSPKPAAGAPAASPAHHAAKVKRPVVIVVTKKVISTRAAAPSVTTSSSGGGVSYVAAPVAAPVAVSCGTPPC